MMRPCDRNGQPFTGTPEELKRHNAKLRKQASRAKAAPVLELPLPPGIDAALNRVCAAAGFEDPRELLDLQIRSLDALLVSDRQLFDALTRVTVTVSGLEKYYPLLNGVDSTEPQPAQSPPRPLPGP